MICKWCRNFFDCLPQANWLRIRFFSKRKTTVTSYGNYGLGMAKDPDKLPFFLTHQSISGFGKIGIIRLVHRHYRVIPLL